MSHFCLVIISPPPWSIFPGDRIFALSEVIDKTVPRQLSHGGTIKGSAWFHRWAQEHNFYAVMFVLRPAYAGVYPNQRLNNGAPLRSVRVTA